MENEFSIEIELNNEQLSFPARLDTIGFIHKIHVIVNNIDVIFEPDEERNYRAIVHAETVNRFFDKDKQTIIAIGEQLSKLKG